MRRTIILLLFIFCTVWLVAQDGVRRGVLEVKLTPGAARRLEQAVQPLSVESGTLKVGIARLDQVHARYQAVSMEPVFNVGGKYEARQRRAGLHLWYNIKVNDNTDILTAAADYLSSGEVEAAGPKYEIVLYDDVAAADAATPNDPEYYKQWHYNNTGQESGAVPGIDINLPEAWSITTGDPRVIVAVTDQGIDYNHPDLADNMWPQLGYNFVRKSSMLVFSDTQFHGTHVAGTVAARSNNGTGVAGVAGGWGDRKGVQLMSCQIIDRTMEGNSNADMNAAAKAFVWAADHGAVISQNSWGYAQQYAEIASDRVAIQYFIDNAGKDEDGNPLPGTLMSGGIVIFASGNNSSPSANTWFPGAWPEIMQVANIKSDGRMAFNSNHGTSIDISAPGSNVLSTHPGAKYSSQSGTSMACPHVSGVAALALSVFGSESYTPDMLWEHLLASTNLLTGESLQGQGQLGAGMIDAYKAVSSHVAAAVIIPETFSVSVNGTATLPVSLIPANTTSSVIWTSLNAAVAKVNKDGAVSGVSLGTAKIVAITDNGKRDTCVVTVSAPATGISIAPTSLVLGLTEEAILISVVTPSEAGSQSVQWASEDPSIASVDASGKVTAHTYGRTRISVSTTDGKFTAYCSVTVQNPALPASIKAPEGFSPNNDGINDELVIKHELSGTYRLRIFDRSGQTHYQSDNYNDDWTGIANTGPQKGEKLRAGTYFYTVSVKENNIKKSGYIIIRY